MHKTFTHTQRRTWMHCHSRFPSLFLSVICTHTHTVCCVCRKLELMTDFVLCVCSLSCPLDTLYPPSRKQPFVFLSLSLSLLLSVYLSLSCSRCLPTFFSLWRIELFCCALLYILPTVYIFLAPDNRYMSTAVGVFFFLADTSHSHFPVNGAIKTAHKKRHLNANMVNIEP